MNRVLDWLYVGPYRDALDAALLREAGIEAVLSLAYPIRHDDIFVRYVPFDDGRSIPEEALHRAVGYARRQRRVGRRLLIACSAGVSRSPAIAIAVLYEVERYPLVEAFRTVLTRVPSASPAPAVWNSLCRHYRQMVGVNDVWPSSIRQ
jgi:protein-tyrosine phosphatase